MMIVLAAITHTAGAAPQPGSIDTYKDWTIGCDNGGRCEAVSLSPAEQMALDGVVSAHVVRESGPDSAPRLWLRLPAEVQGAVELLVDGTFATRLTAKDDALEVTGPDALALLGKLAKGRTLEAHSGGKTLGTASLAGSAAALRLMDARQGRAGTLTALVAKGKLAARVVPAAPALPLIHRVATPQAESGGPLWREELARAAMLAGCTEEQTEHSLAAVHPLGGERALVFLPCGAGAYNYLSVPLIAQGKAGRREFAIAMFDYKPGWSEDFGHPILVNAQWDAKSGAVSNHAKGRGLGDCGNSERYVWDGHRFRLTEKRAMNECRGAWDWITLWRAQTAVKK